MRKPRYSVYVHSCSAIEPFGYRTRDIVPSQSTFNLRDSNLDRAAVWAVDFARITSIFTRQARFQRIFRPLRLHTYLLPRRIANSNGKLLTPRGIDRAARFRAIRNRVSSILRKRARKDTVCSFRDRLPIIGMKYRG